MYVTIMSSGNNKRKSIGGFGFLTALELMNDDNDNTSSITQARGSNNDNIESLATANIPSISKQPHMNGNTNDTSHPPPLVHLNSKATSFTIDLTIRGLQFYKENVGLFFTTSESTITFQRQPDNEHDENAIVCYHGTRIIGHIAKEQAAILASLMDKNIIQVDFGLVKEQTDKSLLVTLDVKLLHDEKRVEFDTLYQRMRSVIYKTRKQVKRSNIINEAAVEQYAFGITQQDSDTAATCPIDICQQPRLPWKKKKNGDGTIANWPPSQEILQTMCVGDANDEEWWQETAGLKPPSQWNVTGAIDLLPCMSISHDQKSRACEVLDDAVHGVTNVWSDETLEGMRELMHSEDFWNHRGSGECIDVESNAGRGRVFPFDHFTTFFLYLPIISLDAFIRSFGGPYVLGQNEGNLKLIKGSPHVPLTEKICRGHNLVYEMIHSEKSPLPGFNTIIFGLNLRRSGFHYHRDTIASLKAKNEPMIPHQPVVTTVYYQKPHVDNGKELVLWKPLLNFNPKGDSLYLAARGIQTTHGMVHVQKAGLQRHAQHGIFHTPIFSNDGEGDRDIASSDPRQGYRVAITARITYPDSEQRLGPYIKKSHYQRVIGPNGQSSLLLS